MRLYTTADLASMNSNLMKRSFQANLLRIQPNGGAAPLFALSGYAKERRIKAVADSYWIKRAVFPSVTLANGGAVTSGATSFTVADASPIVVGAVLMYYKSVAGSYSAPELLRIDSIAGNVVTVTRGVGGTTATSIPDTTVLYQVASAFEEGSARPVARSIEMEEHTNFTQIFRDSWDVTRTAAQVSLEPTVDLQHENKEDAAFFHAQSIEWATLFGRKGTQVINGRPARYMDGIESIITQFAPGNISAAAATTSFAQLEAMLHPTLDYAVDGRTGTTRTILAGSKAIEVINNIGRKSGYYELVPDNTHFGMQFRKFTTSRGTFELIEHPLLNAHAALRGTAIVAELGGLDFMQLQPTMHQDVAFNGQDATSGVYTTELTVKVSNPLAWGMIHNLTAAA